ncbi:MAG: hypothetical protein HC865_25445 [Cyanobacteria bacterium RU_5_0]|nr:hypothetical protein [Cyanobacteria bacterium RU_5_0]
MAGFSVKFNYGMQWSLSFGLGVFWWFVAISFARFVHPVLQFVLMLVPIAFFVYAIVILPKWQKEGQDTFLALCLFALIGYPVGGLIGWLVLV